MEFERYRDSKKAIGLGIDKAIENIIKNAAIRSTESGSSPIKERANAIAEIKRISEWEVIFDITSYDSPHLIKFRVTEPTGIKIITYSLSFKDLI